MYVCAYIYVDIYADIYTPMQVSYYGIYCILDYMENWKYMTPQLKIIKIWLYTTKKTWIKVPLTIPEIIKSDSISQSSWKWHIEPISQAGLEPAVSYTFTAIVQWKENQST